MHRFLVVLDDSRECLNAMRFAAMGAARSGRGVQILSVIPPAEFRHWIGAGEIMRKRRASVYTRIPRCSRNGCGTGKTSIRNW